MFALRSPRFVAPLPLFALALAAACPQSSPDGSVDPTEARAANPTESTMPTPPRAEKRPFTVESPNGSRVDPYYWLRDDEREDPEVIAYLEAENAYRDALLEPVAELRASLYEEIIGRLKQDDSTVPYRDRGFYYYSRYEEGKEYAIHARKAGSLDAQEQVLLDENQLAEGHDYYSISGMDVTPNGKILAFSDDTVGRRQYTLRFKDLETGEMLEDTIEGLSSSFAWAADNRTIFYVENDPTTLLGVRVKRHVLGEKVAEDSVVYEESDNSFYMGVGQTGDHAYILIHLGSTVSDEVRYLSAKDPNGEFRVFEPRARDHEYDVDHMDGRWVVRTNWEAKDFRLMELDDGAFAKAEKKKSLSKANWRELVPAAAGTFIGGFELFNDYLVVQERSEGLQRIRIRDWKGKNERWVETDQEVYSAELDINSEQDSDWLRYDYTSLTTPWTTYEVNMKTGERRLLKRQEIVGDFDPANYETQRMWATARDGVRVPISLVWRKGTPRDGTAPLYLYGYGSYGASMDPSFRSSVLSLLDRGFVYAIAHIRGGQEMGRDWYEQGKLLNKMNTFTDFIDVTEHLVAAKVADPGRVVAAGGSAGGLLVGAVANLRPDLYDVIVAHVPFVDVVTTMLDESIPLTTNEFDEWGNPKEAAFYDYMLSYSPYDQVEAKDYPAFFIATGLWDSQVQYYEPAKWVAKLRELKTDDEPLLFSINMDAGHGGASGRFRRYEETAMEYAYLLHRFGLDGAP